ncbi:MAG: hypothetical protein ACKVOM_11550 [Ferruginibacter sp.]
MKPVTKVYLLCLVWEGKQWAGGSGQLAVGSGQLAVGSWRLENFEH